MTRNVTPAPQFEPDGVIVTGPTPEMTTTTLDGAQPALSEYWTAKRKSVDGPPLPGETVPPDRLGTCDWPLQLAATTRGAGLVRSRATASIAAVMMATSARLADRVADQSVMDGMLR